MPAHAVPKLETFDTPTEKLVKESNPIRTIVDVNGRTIRYRNLSILERARLARVLGENSGNAIYFGMLATAAAVQDIDDERGPPTSKMSFLEARLEWLGDDGWDAIIADDRARAEADAEPENKTLAAKN